MLDCLDTPEEYGWADGDRAEVSGCGCESDAQALLNEQLRKLGGFPLRA